MPQDGAVAIAVMPEEPPNRWDRFVGILFAVAAVVVLGLFAYSMLDAYVL
jgi:hypothetical protein